MIIYKSKDEIERLAVSGRIVAEVIKELRKNIQVGVTTLELDKIAEDFIIGKKAKPAFKGYGKGGPPFPNTLCTSINHEVVHGIPSKNKLKDGDILSIDVGVYYDGYFGDSAFTVGVGNVTEEARKLIQVTEEALYAGIEQAVKGNHLSDIGHAIQGYAEQHGFSVVRDFVGHGIGANLHEEPQVPNFGPSSKGVKLREGMTLAIEPMVNVGGYQVKVLPDNWTVVTTDGSLSAHYEHTVAVTENGTLILSKL